MPAPKSRGTPVSELITDEQINAFIRSLNDRKERREALVLTEWLLTKDFERLVSPKDLPIVTRGEDPPDFVISDENKKNVAVEVSTFVTERKAILDKSPAFSGGYTSTLRRIKADAEFHAGVKEQRLSDNSRIRPHFENTADLERDYYETIKPVLCSKIAAAKQYAKLFDHTVILIEDSLSEFEGVIQRRLPELRSYLQSLQPPANVEVILTTIGKRRAGNAYRL